MMEQTNIVDGRISPLKTNLIYSRPDLGFYISEEEGSVNVTMPPNLAAMYADSFTLAKGVQRPPEGGNIIWSLPKGHQTETILNSVTKTNIADSYKMRTPLPVAVAPALPVPMGYQAQSGNPGLDLATSFAALSTTSQPMPTFQSGVPEPTYSNPYGQVQMPQQGQPGFIPVVQKKPVKTIYQDVNTWIVDYSDKSIGVFLSLETYKTNGPYFATIGKLTKLYPDGPDSPGKFGYIMAKSMEDSMKALSQIIGQDIHTLSDFSAVKKGGGKWGSQQGGQQGNQNFQQFIGGAAAPAQISAPLPSMMDIPGLTSNLPFVPRVEEKETVESLVSKLMRLDLTDTTKEEVLDVLIWGSRDYVNNALTDTTRPLVRFDCVMGDKRIVAYSKPQV